MPTYSPTVSDVLVIVDVQNDFLPGGALAVPDGDFVIPVINKLSQKFTSLVLTQDWHPSDHISFASNHPGKVINEEIEVDHGRQILWPDHCVQGTHGAAFSSALWTPHAPLIIRKGLNSRLDSYSAFTEADRVTKTGLAGYLHEIGAQHLFITGLATDFCVAWTALDAVSAGFQVSVIEDATKGIDIAGSLRSSWVSMLANGINRIKSRDIS